MKRLFATLILALYASSSLASTLPSTVIAPSTTAPANSSLFDYIPNNSSLLDEVTEATIARNNLKVIPTSQIGQQLVTQAELSATASLSGYTMGAVGLAGLAYYQRTGKDPVYAAYQAVASAADAVFSPAYQAFKANFVSPESYPASAAQYIGKESSAGATIDSLVNLAKGSPSSYPLLNDIINSNSSDASYPSNYASAFPQGESIATTNGTVVKLTGPTLTSGMAPEYFSGQYAQLTYKFPIAGGGCFSTNPETPASEWYCWNGTSYNGTWLYQFWAYYGQLVGGTPTIPIPVASINYEGLKNSIQAANADAAFADEVRTAIKNTPAEQKITSSDPQPTTVPAPQPSPITNNDVSNFFTANTTNIYNEYLNTVNNGGDVNTAQAAAELAKAQEEEAEKETEEKFNQIPTNSFDPPYEPGPFDIPARFTTFLGNVKSSGLFSFSSAFFDSLPGGGSPVYTVDAGHYGSHTIDLSDTMSTGLAVLKSILLACFGFLSIRAVIMKR